MSNVYYDTEDFGFERVDVLDEPNLSYEFNTFLVLKHTASGRVFYAQDSGCSCPTPFEDYYFRVDGESVDTNLDEVTQTSWLPFERAVENFPVSMSERQECLKKTADALKQCT